MTPDTPAAVAALVLAHITADPDTYDQRGWTRHHQAAAHPCGSAMCIAGWAAHLTGWDIDIDGTARRNGQYAAVGDVAAAALGLNEPEELAMFHPRNPYAARQLGRIATGRRPFDGNPAESSWWMRS